MTHEILFTGSEKISIVKSSNCLLSSP